jgi:hypothetical protein
MNILPHTSGYFLAIRPEYVALFNDTCSGLILSYLEYRAQGSILKGHPPDAALIDLGKIAIADFVKGLVGTYKRDEIINRLHYLEQIDVVSASKDLSKRRLSVSYGLYKDFCTSLLNGVESVPSYSQWMSRQTGLVGKSTINESVIVGKSTKVTPLDTGLVGKSTINESVIVGKSTKATPLDTGLVGKSTINESVIVGKSTKEDGEQNGFSRKIVCSSVGKSTKEDGFIVGKSTKEDSTSIYKEEELKEEAQNTCAREADYCSITEDDQSNEVLDPDSPKAIARRQIAKLEIEAELRGQPLAKLDCGLSLRAAVEKRTQLELERLRAAQNAPEPSQDTNHLGENQPAENDLLEAANDTKKDPFFSPDRETTLARQKRIAEKYAANRPDSLFEGIEEEESFVAWMERQVVDENRRTGRQVSPLAIAEAAANRLRDSQPKGSDRRWLEEYRKSLRPVEQEVIVKQPLRCKRKWLG